jgi:hypothetical protein
MLSVIFEVMAEAIDEGLPECPEKTVALEKLLDARNYLIGLSVLKV